MKTTLIIDTSSSEKMRVGVDYGGKMKEAIAPKHTQAQVVLPMVEELLESQKMTLSDIKEIKVHTGPGSYTGLRVGIAIANMLGTLLDVSINGLPVAQTVSPTYQGDRYKS